MSEETQVAEATTEEVKTEETSQDGNQERLDTSGLDKLSAKDLIDIIHETRSEAKTRRLKYNELKEQMSAIEIANKKAEEEQLEKDNEFKTLYERRTEETKDYDELKEFKMNYLNNCKDKIESIKNGLTKAESELFELSSKSMPYDEQLQFIEKLVGNRTTAAIIDKTQSTTRSNNDDMAKDDKPTPFGSGSLTSNIMNMLNKARPKQ
jgi:hypothetical protein